MTLVKNSLVQVSLDAQASLFTVQAFAAGIVSVLAQSPKFAVRNFYGTVSFDPDSVEESSVDMTIEVSSLDLLDEVRSNERREIERVMFDEVVARNAMSSPRSITTEVCTVSMRPSAWASSTRTPSASNSQFCRSNHALDGAAKRGEVLLQDALRLVLRKYALEIAAAVQALRVRAAKLIHVRVIGPAAADMLGGLHKGRQQADGIEDRKRARLDRCGACFPVPLCVTLDQPHVHAVADKLGGSEQPRRAGANDQNFLCHDQLPENHAIETVRLLFA
jgi:hypothetical protein